MNRQLSTKQVMFVLPCMKGGGAERVASLLANEFYRTGLDVTFLLTSSTPDEVVRVDLAKEIPLKLLSEMPVSESLFGKAEKKLARIGSSVVCKAYEYTKQPVPASWAFASFWSEYKIQIAKLRSILVKNPALCVIAFLQPAIPIALLAARGLDNKVIISERGDPLRLMKKRYGRRFIEKYYPRTNAAVFQTEDAKNAYPACVSSKGTVIPNPIKDDLPAPYHGERNYNITTFCRISASKNLPVLLKAFQLLHQDHPDYKLRIIGDTTNSEGQAVQAQLTQFIRENGLEQAVIFEPFMMNVHDAVIRDAMYVNSSDYEGISNAMLEAMAIGMPVVCTDCPIGGAKATITDSENGLLVPIKDPEALYHAMKRVIEEPGLADKLSHNAAKLRDALSLERMAEKWMNVLLNEQ